MLNHKNTVELYFASLVLLWGLHYWINISIAIPLLLTLVFIGLEVYGAIFVQSGFHVKTINQLNTSENKVALTFDDGPDPENTPKILALLEKYNTKATFFIIGKKIEGQEEILKQIIKQGHEIGNHSFEHSPMYDLKNKKQFVEDLILANQAIEKAIGFIPEYFRPPYGVTTPGLGKACRELNFKVIGWNVRSLDTVTPDKNKVVERVMQKVKPGSIILLHDPLKDADYTLEQILIKLQEKNYSVVPLKEYI